MPNPATAQDTSALKAALLASGMLADRGRYSPFASIAGDANANPEPATGAPVSLQSAVAGNAASGGVVVPSSGAATSNDKTALPVSDNTLNKMSEGDATDLLVALGVTGAAALTAYLARRRAKINNPVADGEAVPLVEGQTLDSEGKEAKTSVVDGEFTEVPNKQIGTTKKIAQGATVPDNQGMKALGAPKQVDVPSLTDTKAIAKGKSAARKTLAQAMIDRANKAQPNDVAPIPVTDNLTDVTQAERNQAETLMEQLRQNRTAGNAANRARMTGNRTLRSTFPTGTVNRDTLFNTIIGLIREGKTSGRALARIIP